MHRVATTQGQRLRRARERAGYSTASDAARAFGWVIPTYSAHENGTRSLLPDVAEKYARHLRVRAAWLLTGDGAMSHAQIPVPVVGYVGAGEVVLAVDDHEPGAGLDTVERPPGVTEDDLVALRIRGDSMRPLRDGWIVYYRRDADGVADDCINQLCVIRTTDGETYLKELRRGYSPGCFNLVSWASGTDPIEDAPVAWAARVLSIRPS